MSRISESVEVPAELEGLRLDQALARLFPDFSRTRLKTWIESGAARLDAAPARPRDRVLAGQTVTIDAELDEIARVEPEPMALAPVFADEHVIVIDKPAGLVVHPGAGQPAGTLQNGLLAFDPRLAGLPRSGIVHRLDKLTSGLMVVARSLPAHTRLVAAMQARRIEREYLALAEGTFTGGGRIDAPIGRHPGDRTRMAVVERGRPAVTHYRIEERFSAHTLLRVRLETGRTHQIRVHLAHLRHPIVGDPVYGGRPRVPKGCTPGLAEALRAFPRQALHATRLAFDHPSTGERLVFESPMPPDIAALVETLRSFERRACAT